MDKEGKKKKKNKRNKKKNKERSLEITKQPENPNAEELNTEETSYPEHQYSDDNDNTKRVHSEAEADSEDDDKPKKKKKKKKLFSEPAEGEKKGKKSIRQMKREKHVQRQAEAQAVAKDQLKSQCLTYLSQWKHDKQNWKFMKAKQVWLYKNKFSTSLLPDSSWPLLLEYFESAKGNVRNLLLEDANKVIKQMDEWTEHNGKESKESEGEDKIDESEEPTEVKKPDETSYKRARDLIQCLQE